MEKEVKFVFDEACLKAFQSLKEKLVLPTIIVGQNWAKPFGIECDANGTTLGALLDHKRNKMFHLFYYASKSLNGAEENYTISEHELLALIYALEKFRAYLVGTKVIVHKNKSAFTYLMTKKDAKRRLIR